MGVNWPRKAVRSPTSSSHESEPEQAEGVRGTESHDGCEGDEEAESEYESSEEEEEPIEDVRSDYSPPDSGEGAAERREVSYWIGELADAQPRDISSFGKAASTSRSGRESAVGVNVDPVSWLGCI